MWTQNGTFVYRSIGERETMLAVWCQREDMLPSRLTGFSLASGTVLQYSLLLKDGRCVVQCESLDEA